MSMFEEFILWFAEINFICNFIIILSMITFIDMFFKLFSCKKKYNVKLGAQETQLYNKYSADVYKTIVLNIENLDKNVLAMTTFFLGLSLIFLKDIVDDEIPMRIVYIYSSWSFFLTSITLTMLSFILGWKENEAQIDNYRESLITKEEFKTSKIRYVLIYCNYLSLSYLILGITYLYLFVKTNF